MDYASLQSEELVRRCVEGGAVEVWQEFIRRFHPLILRTVVRVARRWGESSPQVYDDLAQDRTWSAEIPGIVIPSEARNLHLG